MENNANTPATTSGTSANNTPRVPTGLKDKLDENQDSGPISRWDGKANPVPDQVDREYWIRLYNRADSHLYNKAKEAVKKKAAENGEDVSDAVISARVKRRQEISRDIDETWDMALQIMIRDILSADEELPARASEKTKNKRLALRQTRELLGNEFFDFMSRYDQRAVMPRRLVDPAELADDLEERIWYGDGSWVTKLPLN